MKYLWLYVIASLISIYGNCQNKDITYNTDIGAAENVEIKDGNIYIKKANTVVVKVEIVDPKYNLLIDSVFTRYDTTSSSFITIVKFIGKNSPKLNVDLQFNANDTILGAGIKTISPSTSMMQKNFSSDKKQVFFIGTIFSEKGFYIGIKSKRRLSITVNGIAGMANH